jgi:hypothetical protein
MKLEEFKSMVRDEKIKSTKAFAKSERVKAIIDERNDGLPAYPSAQWWRTASQEERDDLMATVESTGNKWSTFEREMKAHWPKH